MRFDVKGTFEIDTIVDDHGHEIEEGSNEWVSIHQKLRNGVYILSIESETIATLANPFTTIYTFNYELKSNTEIFFD